MTGPDPEPDHHATSLSSPDNIPNKELGFRCLLSDLGLGIRVYGIEGRKQGTMVEPQVIVMRPAGYVRLWLSDNDKLPWSIFPTSSISDFVIIEEFIGLRASCVPLTGPRSKGILFLTSLRVTLAWDAQSLIELCREKAVGLRAL